MQLQPYLFFEGRCEEAFDFYAKALGGEVLAVMRYKESPDPAPVPAGSDEKVMHAALRIGDVTLMGSDGMCSGQPDFSGFSVSLTVDGSADAEAKFGALSEGAAVQMPMGETFFAERFGMLKDRFGVSWMILAGPKNA